MSEIDPVEFGKMCGYVEATHEMVSDIKKSNIKQDDKITEHTKRLQNLENRNENIKKNWKRAGWASATGAGALGAIKAFFVWIT